MAELAWLLKSRAGLCQPSFQRTAVVLHWWPLQSGTFTLKKLECSKQAFRYEYISME
jgi:hypothetical protein